MKYYFSHARTALKYGLMQYKITNNTEILLPDYICDVILHPIKKIKLNYNFYRINDNFTPDWEDLLSKINDNTKFLLIVNFFGKNQNIKKLINLKKRNDLILIEDNAHGYGSKFDNDTLENIYDFSISSPRKIVSTNSGGILDIKDNHIINLNEIAEYKNIYNFDILKKLFLPFPELKNYIKKKFLKRKRYESFSEFRESQINDYLIDSNSLKKINNVDFDKLLKFRNSEYQRLYKFTIQKGLTPAYDSFDHNLMPWCFPAYTKSHKESIDWFNWGWENNVPIFSWPTLPDEMITKNSICVNRWKKLICFGI